MTQTRNAAPSFNPLDYECAACGAPAGIHCPERHFVGFIQLTCRVRELEALERGRQGMLARKYPHGAQLSVVAHELAQLSG